MELKLLEDFLCLADMRNFSRAAEVRHITQSTLSKRVRALEQWVGSPLVDRTSYPIRLTAEGEAMLPQARELVASFLGMRAGIRTFATSPGNSLRLGAMHTLKVSYLPRWRRWLEADMGPVNFEMGYSFHAHAQTLRQFRNGETELFLTYVHPSVPNGLEGDCFESLLISNERVLPVSAPDPAGEPLHRPDTGCVIRFLSYGNSSFFAQAMAPMLNERPLPLNVTASNTMCVALHSLARVGAGLAWIPESLVAEDLRTGELVVAGGPEWAFHVEARLYRARGSARPIVENVWQSTKRLLSEGTRPLATAPRRSTV